MKECAPDVEIAFSPGQKHQRRDAVDHDPNGSDDHHRFPADFAGMGEAPQRFPGDSADSNQQQNRIPECGENGRATKPVGSTYSRSGLAEIICSPGEQESEDIAEVVSCVGEQGERMRRDSKNDLRDNERDVEGGADCECHSEILPCPRGRRGTIRMGA